MGRLSGIYSACKKSLEQAQYKYEESSRFDMGQWMLLSHGATGIDGLSIPIQVADANKRIADFLDNLTRTEGKI